MEVGDVLHRGQEPKRSENSMEWKALTLSNHGLGRAPLSALPFSRGEEITSQQLVSVAEPHFLALPLHAVIRVTGTAVHAEKQG